MFGSVNSMASSKNSSWVKIPSPGQKKKRRVEIRPSTSRHTLPMAKRLKILGSTYLVGKIKLKLVFSGFHWLSETLNPYDPYASCGVPPNCHVDNLKGCTQKMSSNKIQLGPKKKKAF